MLDWLRAGGDGGLWAMLSVLDLPAFSFLVLKGRRARAARAAPRVPVSGRARGRDAAAGDRRAAQRRACPAYLAATRDADRGRGHRDDRQRGAAAGAAADGLRRGRTPVRRAVHDPPRRAVRAGALHGDRGALGAGRGTGPGDLSATRRTARRRPDAAVAAGMAAADGARDGAVGPPHAARDDRPPILPRALRRTPHPADAGLRQRPRAQPAGTGDAGVGGSRPRAAPATRGAEHPGPGRRRAARSAAAAAAAVDRQPAGGAAGRLAGATRRLARARLAVRARATAVGRSPMARGHPRAAAGAAPRAHRVAAGRDDAGTQAQRAAVQRRRPAAADGRRRIGGAGDRPAPARRIRRDRDGGHRPPTTSLRRRSASAAAASTRAARRNAVDAAATCAIRCCRHTWPASSPSIAASAPAAWASSTRATTSRSIAWWR